MNKFLGRLKDIFKREYSQNVKTIKNILIVGAGHAGGNVIDEINESPELGINILGIIDDDPSKKGEKIKGVSVLGTRSLIKEMAKEGKVDEIIIAIPSASGDEISKLVKICSEAHVGFKIVPRVKEIIEGVAHFNNVREVRVEDLLGRPVIKSDVVGLKKFFKGKNVLVTGAAGSIGSELSRQIAAYGPKQLILLDWWENGLFQLDRELKENFSDLNTHYAIGNIQDMNKINLTFQKFKPNYVFHAAAYKHVPLMEDNPEEAVKNNVFGSLNVAEAAANIKVEKFVLVSTDKAANPVNVMGMTKLITEGIVKILNGKTKFVTVRFGNVLDSYGSVIPIFREQIAKGGPVTVTDERMTRYFMTIPEAAQLILKAGSLGNGGELFVLDMGKPMRILDLAENMIRLSGLVPGKDIKIVFTGVRKGEKLEERLFNDNEELQSTKENKIFRSKSLGIETEKLKSSLKLLEKYAKEGDSENIKKEFSKLSPTFKS